MGYSYDNIMDKKFKLIKDKEEKENVLRLSELGLVPHQILYEPIIFNKKEEMRKII